MENLHHIHRLINSLLHIRLKTLMPEGIPGFFHPSSPDPSEKRCGLALGFSEFLMIIGKFFGHTLVFLEKISLITTRKAEMLDGMFPAQIECNCLPVIHKSTESQKVADTKW